MGEHLEHPTVAFDLDGTLAEDRDTDDVALPRYRLLWLLQRLMDGQWRGAVYTTRGRAHVNRIRQWLYGQGLYAEWMDVWPGKERYDVLVDDRALPALEHCTEALEEVIALALDDPRRRPVAPPAATAYGTWSNRPTTRFRRRLRDVGENPGEHAEDQQMEMRVIVPFTGGLDSFTAYAMAESLGLNPVPVYVDAGQPYAAAEQQVAPGLLDVPLVVIPMEPGELTRYEHIEVGRNPAYLLAIAQRAQPHGPAEVWMGTRGDELKWWGGDKSMRFHITMQQVLTLLDYDVRIVDPLIGMTKVDCVRWCADHDMLEQAFQTRTCYAAAAGHCGRCWACLQRVLAFHGAGVDGWLRGMPHEVNFSEPAAELWRKADARVAAGQRPGRDPATWDTLAALGYDRAWWEAYRGA